MKYDRKAGSASCAVRAEYLNAAYEIITVFVTGVRKKK